MSNYVVEVNNLSKNYKGFKAVNGVNLNIKEGRIYGFLGPNGAGKSTTIRMILGLIKSSSGNIKVFDKSLKQNRSSILKNVGALVEAPSYYGHLNAYENLKIWAAIKGVDKEAIDNTLNLVGLYEHRKRKVSKFSLGMKQRLGIAQALIGDPELVILDEPTNGLDPMGIKEIRNLIVDLAKNHNKTIIVSSHILSEMELMVDDIGIINRGKILYEGSLLDLKAKYDSNLSLEDIFLDLTGGK